MPYPRWNHLLTHLRIGESRARFTLEYAPIILCILFLFLLVGDSCCASLGFVEAVGIGLLADFDIVIGFWVALLVPSRLLTSEVAATVEDEVDTILVLEPPAVDVTLGVTSLKGVEAASQSIVSSQYSSSVSGMGGSKVEYDRLVSLTTRVLWETQQYLWIRYTTYPMSPGFSA